ncbi:MAG: hypothetical protein U0169_03580 [Polyangiaceae bacterium]
MRLPGRASWPRRPRGRAFRPALSAWIVLAVVACGRTGNAPPAPDAGGTASSATEACRTFAEAACSKRDICGQLDIAIGFGSLDTCQVATRADCERRLGAPGSAMTAASTLACAQSLPELACDRFRAGRLPDSCLHPRGSLDAGAPCIFDDQCASGTCTSTRLDGCGTCDSKVAAKEGQACTDETPCEAPLACVGGACTTLRIQDESCDASHPCAGGWTCASSKCARGAGLDAPCGGEGGPSCDTTSGLVCDPAANRCRRLVVASNGRPCGRVGESLVLCDQGGTCHEGADGTSTCVDPVEFGGECHTLPTQHCRPPSTCNGSNRCQVVGPKDCPTTAASVP